MVVNKQYHLDPRVVRYIEALADEGAQVDVLCVKGPSESPENKNRGIRVYTIPISCAQGSISRYFLQYGAALILFWARLLVLHTLSLFTPST